MLGLSIFKKKTDRQDLGETGALSARGVIALACEHRVAASVKIGEEESFGTTFVGFDTDGRYFYTDLLLPRHGEDLMLAGESVAEIVFMHNGVRYSFDSLFEGVDFWEGFDSLKFAMPKSVTAVQRRNDFRVEPRIGEPVLMILLHEGVEVTRAINISAGGARFRTLKPMEPGTEAQVYIKLPGERETMLISARILDSARVERPASRKNTMVKRYEIRSEFSGAPSSILQAIRRYVVNRQRELINFPG